MSEYLFTCQFCCGDGCDKCDNTGTEPDRYETEFRGRKIFVRRMALGHLCGYAEVSSEKMAETIYDQEMGREDCERECIDVHGGVTFGGLIDGKPFVGFDCAHAGDYIPNGGFDDGIYRDMRFVLREAKNLARQLDEIDPEFKNKKEK